MAESRTVGRSVADWVENQTAGAGVGREQMVRGLELIADSEIADFDLFEVRNADVERAFAVGVDRRLVKYLIVQARKPSKEAQQAQLNVPARGQQRSPDQTCQPSDRPERESAEGTGSKREARGVVVAFAAVALIVGVAYLLHPVLSWTDDQFQRLSESLVSRVEAWGDRGAELVGVSRRGLALVVGVALAGLVAASYVTASRLRRLASVGVLLLLAIRVLQVDPPAPLDQTAVVGFDDDRSVALKAFEILDAASLARPDDAVLTPAALRRASSETIVPAGSDVSVRSETWERSGRLAAVVVDVSLQGSAEPDEFVAYLVETSDGWRLSSTERVDGP